jgi:hypothetical protein
LTSFPPTLIFPAKVFPAKKLAGQAVAAIHCDGDCD